MLTARLRPRHGVAANPIVTLFDNAQSDADQVLPTSANLPAAAPAQPVTPIPSS
jgi:hypothetical protein